MNEIRLDFLLNFPQNQLANKELIQNYPNLNLLDGVKAKNIDSTKREIARYFSYTHVDFFSYSIAGFIELFLHFTKRLKYKILLFPTLSNLSFKAYSLLDSADISLGTMSSFTISNDDLKRCIKDNDVIMLPVVNMDLLSTNDILDTIKLYKDKIFILDISLAIYHLNLSEFYDLDNVILMLNGENIGILKNSAILISNINLNLKSIYQNGIEKAYKIALDSIFKPKNIIDTKYKFFDTLSSILGDAVSLFAPLNATLPNTIALRLKGIKARMLTQSLMIENIYVINGINCLHGYFTPSYVLENIGYEMHQCSELLGISYENLSDEDISLASQKIATCYKQSL